MRVTELLEISTCILRVMAENGIYRDDWQYLKAYEEFLCMRENKVKYYVAIQELAEELDVSTRTLERAFKRLGKECK